MPSITCLSTSKRPSHDFLQDFLNRHLVIGRNLHNCAICQCLVGHHGIGVAWGTEPLSVQVPSEVSRSRSGVPPTPGLIGPFCSGAYIDNHTNDPDPEEIPEALRDMLL
jgi:hypothetical protein